jgi:hypothetical protein
VRQFDVGDFVYFKRQPNDILNTSSNCTVMRIKVIKPSSVLEGQRADKRTIWDHPKNCVPYHVPNLNPTIIKLISSPPLDYPCRVCQRTNNVNQMLFCDNCNGGYHLFCLKLEFNQVPADIWYCSSCSPTTPWFLFRPCHVFPSSNLGGDTWEFHLNLFLCIVYIRACIFFWLISFYIWLVLIFLFSRGCYGFTPLRHRMSRHYTSWQMSCMYAWLHTRWPVMGMPIMPSKVNVRF